MLEKDVKCWICKRTEEEIIKEIEPEDGLIKDIGEDADKWGTASRKKMIRLRDVGSYGYGFPICALCEGLIYNIADRAAQDRIEFEIDEKRLLDRGDLRNIKIRF